MPDPQKLARQPSGRLLRSAEGRLRRACDCCGGGGGGPVSECCSLEPSRPDIFPGQYPCAAPFQCGGSGFPLCPETLTITVAINATLISPSETRSLSMFQRQTVQQERRFGPCEGITAIVDASQEGQRMVGSATARIAQNRFHPAPLPPMGWLLGEGVWECRGGIREPGSYLNILPPAPPVVGPCPTVAYDPRLHAADTGLRAEVSVVPVPVGAEFWRGCRAYVQHAVRLPSLSDPGWTRTEFMLYTGLPFPDDLTRVVYLSQPVRKVEITNLSINGLCPTLIAGRATLQANYITLGFGDPERTLNVTADFAATLDGSGRCGHPSPSGGTVITPPLTDGGESVPFGGIPDALKQGANFGCAGCGN